jgi:hypothetical protein
VLDHLAALVRPEMSMPAQSGPPGHTGCQCGTAESPSAITRTNRAPAGVLPGRPGEGLDESVPSATTGCAGCPQPDGAPDCLGGRALVEQKVVERSGRPLVPPLPITHRNSLPPARVSLPGSAVKNHPLIRQGDRTDFLVSPNCNEVRPCNESGGDRCAIGEPADEGTRRPMETRRPMRPEGCGRGGG